jgi:hypothetical protein
MIGGAIGGVLGLVAGMLMMRKRKVPVVPAPTES